MQKLEDWFNKEVHIPIMKQPTTVKKKSIATPPQVTATVKAIHKMIIMLISHLSMTLMTLMFQTIRQ